MMQIRLATADDLALVTEIVQRTIREQYPHYYPQGAVTLFLEAHTSRQIGEDVDKGIVYLCLEDQQAVATITIDGNHLTRLYVLPDYQRRGYGSALLDFAEAQAAQRYESVHLESTPLGRVLYRKRGYKETEYHLMWAANGDLLTYDDMEKILHKE